MAANSRRAIDMVSAGGLGPRPLIQAIVDVMAPKPSESVSNLTLNK